MSKDLVIRESDALSRAAKAVIEPLCEATRELFEELRLRPTDRLFLWMDADGKRFLADLRALERVEEEVAPRLVSPDEWVRGEHDVPFGEEPPKVELPPKPARWIDLTDSYGSGGVSRAAMQFFQRVPERRSLEGKGEGSWGRRFKWRLAATDFTALLVHHCWPREQVEFRPPGLNDDGTFQFPVDEEARETFEYLLLRFFAQGERARKVAAFKTTRTVPPSPEHWVERTDRPLADYQRLAVQLADGFDSLALFADRGTGKTAMRVQGVCHSARLHRMAGKGMYRVLCVVPQQARMNWATEFERFATVKGKVTVIRGGLLDRLRALHRVVASEEDLAFSVGIISYESAVNTVDYLCRVPWEEIDFDESHKFKSSRTKRWKAIEQLRDCAAKRVPMTGTPIGNSYMDLWTQLEACGRGLSGFESFEEFRKFHGNWVSVDGQVFGVEKLTALKNVPLLQERLARLTFAITKKEAGLQLPEKVYDFWEVKMTKRQAEVYEAVSTQLRAEIEDRLSDSADTVTVENILTQLLRLAQITSGHVGLDRKLDQLTGETLKERRTEQISWPNPKVEAVIEMLTAEDRDPLGKTIVWSCFVPDIKALEKRLTEAGIGHALYYGGVKQSDRDEMVRRFNWDPDCKVIVCNPQSASEALNLLGYDWDNPAGPQQKTYTDHEIFFACNWSSLMRDQAEDRAHRRGTRTQVRITDLVVPGTIDEEIRARVRQKKQMADLVLDIRAILRAVFTDAAGDDEDEGGEE